MLRPGVTQEWVDEGELPRERTKNQRLRRPYDVDKIMRGYDQELLGDPLWCTTQQGLWIQGVNVVVPQRRVSRRVFRVGASKLALDESLGHQHMGAVYHRGRSQIASTSESYGGDLIIQGMIGAAGELDCFSAHIRLREPDKSDDKANGVEAGGRKGRGSDNESSGAQLPKSKASVRKEVDSKERHSARRDFRGVIDPLLSWRESIGRKRGRGGGEYKGKLQVPRQGGRAEAKELHKTGVDGLLIKIAESEGLWIDAGVLDQGTK
ncbi:hypothetical protein BHM03_00032063 [Ensete ventricosum]|uniref:Uncharacterized protein n=1 Tax=Ensete ventricosum TaxID=4639 RepID=A0A445MIW2_ENSVE|nr:hypothetical protein BHM03_00032063 [Ensete ventricosum]